jgi:hypothetical protein
MMATFLARAGGGLRFLGLLALAGLFDTGSAQAMGAPPTDPNNAIIWQQDFPTQFVGAGSIQLVPPAGTTASFSAVPAGVCAVVDNNTLQIIGVGTCTVTAFLTVGGGPQFQREKTFTIASGPAPLQQQSITWNQTLQATFGVGTIPLTATAAPTLVVSYVAAPSNVCTITGGSTLQIGAAGECTVTASQGGNAQYAAATPMVRTFTIAQAVQSALQVVAANTMSFPGTLSLSTSGGTGTGAVTYLVVSGPCRVSDNTLTSEAIGTCSVTATKASDGTYESVTSSPIVVEVVISGGNNNPIKDRFVAPMVSSKGEPGWVFSVSDTIAGDILSPDGGEVEKPNRNTYQGRDNPASVNSGNSRGSSSFTVPGSAQSGFAFLPQGNSTNGMIAFSGSAGQIVHAAGKGDKQVMPTSAQRPDQGYDPYVRMAGSFDIWIDGRFSWRNDADGEGGLDSKTFVTETGVDYLMTESLLIGLSLRVDNSDGTFGGEGGELEVRGWLAGPYVVWEITPGLQADAKIGYGGGHNDISAIIGGENYGGSYDTTRWRAAAGLRGELEFGSFMIEPGLRAGFYRETTEAFTLSNNGGTVVEQEFTFLRLSFDPRLTYRHVTEEGTSITPFLSPQIAAQWQDARGGRSNWDVFGVVQGGLSIATEDFSLSTNLSASGLGGEGAVSYSAGANLTIPLN